MKIASKQKSKTQPRRVGIDARLVYQTGVGVYIRNLLIQLAKMDTPNIEFHVYARPHDIVAIKDQLPDRKQTMFVFHVTQVPWHSFAEQIIFLYQLLRDRLDLVHFPYFSWPILYFRPFVATVHDTILLSQATGKATTKALWVYWAKNAVFRFVLSQQVKRSKHLMVPSNTVAHEIARIFPSAKGKMSVLYEGVDNNFAHAKPSPIERLEGCEYFLYVGNCYPHKNVETLLQSFEKVIKQVPHVYLCLVGPQNSFSDKIRSWTFQNNLHRSILLYHNLPPSELRWLYTNAKAFVFPSKAEGFGLPIVEAALCNCPLILSDIPVFHEVIGDQARYFGLYDTQTLSRTMCEALDTTERKDFTLNPLFSFEKMAQDTLHIYRQKLNIST